MKDTFALLLCLISTLFAAAPVAPAVPIDREPSHHQVLDNEFLRVFDVTVAAHHATLMHRHDRDYIFLALGDAAVNNERADAKPVRLVLADGEVRYARGGFEHIARNLSAIPFHNMTIEFKNPGALVCGIEATHACETPTLFSTQHVMIRLTALQPGESTPLHTHTGPHLAIAVDNLKFENHSSSKTANTFSMKKGEFAWVGENVTHFFKNVGTRPGRILVVEFH